MSMLELQNSWAKNFRCRDSTELAITKRGKELGVEGGGFLATSVPPFTLKEGLIPDRVGWGGGRGAERALKTNWKFNYSMRF